jgi:methylenetetrahydrofolate reductase (NADPH)
VRQVDPSTSKADSVFEVITARALRQEPTLSFEFFPPKDEEGAATLWRSYDKLLEVSPDFVSVTYGAGGSNRETSLGVVDRMAKDILTIGHLTCVGSTFDGTRETINRFQDAGVKSILALRGDAPLADPDALAKGELKSALDLVTLVRGETSLEIGVAAFPEVHPESPDLAHDAKVLALKQSAGASYAMTQLFFTVDAYLDLVETARLAGATLPIVPGVMPISLNKYIGYEAAAKIAKHSVAKGLTVREATIELGYVDGEKLTMEQLDAALDVLRMTSPDRICADDLV